ncbi:para-nitrobenzyl esterase [Novosphingobium chloroacetimidivorans]|uniref:Para-nitrobenzyl esterase n=1 Tax=Novosphingobium chloroacetimidivorans TaxID=1428314 RepID=A0A7W7NWY8_9SPHN|nr:hypothetical protein [Novosphingobium chloroacetimidivorans]MBB4858889.1 para-nitrobenzyl esterase [Novosphingobium chloroacetimidivorans]
MKIRKNAAFAVLGAMLVTITASPVLAETAKSAATAAAKYNTTDTTIGALMDDPASKAVLVKHVPGMANNPQMDMARSMTLRQVQGYASDMLTDDVLAAIDKDLAALPAK